MAEDPERRQRYVRLVGSLSAIPILLAAGGVIGFFIGQWLDGRLGTDPWLQLVFFFIGMGSGVRSSRQFFAKVSKEMDEL